MQELEQANLEAQEAKLQVEEQRNLSQRVEEEARETHSSIALLQQQVAEASSSLSSAAAAWDAERASLEAAAAGEKASAKEIERRVQAGIAGDHFYQTGISCDQMQGCHDW